MGMMRPILGDRDELDWRDDAALRVVPADQRLEGADAIGLEVEKRLEIKLELALLDGAAQVALDGAPSLRPFVERLLEEEIGAAPLILGAIKREIGIAQQRVDIFGISIRDGDADAGPWQDIVAVDHHWFLDGGENLLCQPFDAVRRTGLDMHYQKFVATQPADEAATCRLGEAMRDLDEHGVTDGMT